MSGSCHSPFSRLSTAKKERMNKVSFKIMKAGIAQSLLTVVTTILPSVAFFRKELRLSWILAFVLSFLALGSLLFFQLFLQLFGLVNVATLRAQGKESHAMISALPSPGHQREGSHKAHLHRRLIWSQTRIRRCHLAFFKLCNLVELRSELGEPVVLFRIWRPGQKISERKDCRC